MITARVRITFNSMVQCIADGIEHMKKVLSTGSSSPICIPPKTQNQLCKFHTEVDVVVNSIIDEENKTVEVYIYFPICLCGINTGISTFLGSLLYYSVFSIVDEYHIIDFDLCTEEVQKLFIGPRHGIEGIRKLCEVPDEPLMGLILKPRTRIDLSYQRSIVSALASSKYINYLIDDELVISPFCCNYQDRIDVYSSLINEMYEKYSCKMIYWVNAACDIPISEEIIQYGLKHRINTFSLNPVTMGFSSVKYIIDKYSNDALFILNNISRGVLTRMSGFSVSERVLAKISRLIGADAVYTGPITYDFAYDKDILNKERTALQDRWENYKKSFCVSSGSINSAKIVKENVQALGKDTMIQMGGALLTQDTKTISKLKALKIMVSNALDPEIMRELQNSFVDMKGETIMNQDTSRNEKKRADLLNREISCLVRDRIRLKTALVRVDNPIKEGDYEDTLEKCELAIMGFAVELASISVKYPDIEIGDTLSDILDICKRHASKVDSSYYAEFESDILSVSNDIKKDVKNEGKTTENIEKISSDIKASGSFELTIPIIPSILTYKTQFSMETKMKFRKMLVSIFGKIKNVL